MRPEDRDAAHVHDAIVAGSGIANMMRGVTFDDYIANDVVRLAVEREYDEIDNHRIFVIATELVPALVAQLTALLPPIPPDPEPE